MIKCDCYCVEEQIIGWHTPVDPKIKIVHKCHGTRERDECSCGGDRTKCDFYPEVREKALKEQEPKFGEWISVEDRLPEAEDYYLVFIIDRQGKTRMEVMKLFKWANCFDWSAHMSSFWKDHNTITHWMPLPEPPTE